MAVEAGGSGPRRFWRTAVKRSKESPALMIRGGFEAVFMDIVCCLHICTDSCWRRANLVHKQEGDCSKDTRQDMHQAHDFNWNHKVIKPLLNRGVYLEIMGNPQSGLKSRSERTH